MQMRLKNHTKFTQISPHFMTNKIKILIYKLQVDYRRKFYFE
jgi:hypothetical protein